MSESRFSTRAKHTNVLALAVPQVILFGGMLVMLVVHPNAVRSGLMTHTRDPRQRWSPRGLVAALVRASATCAVGTIS